MSAYVLVVENTGFFRQTLNECIKEAGFHPIEAKALAEASARLSQYRFAAAIVDVRMKDENDSHDWSGLVEARHIAQSKVPVIILSAHDSSEDIERAYTVSLKELAPRAFISKNSPNWPERVIEVLAEITAEQRRGWQGWLKEHWEDLLSFLSRLVKKLLMKSPG